MNLIDLYEMKDPRDAYQRDYDSSVNMGKRSGADVTGEEEPSGIFTVVIDGKPWKTGSSNEMFALAGRIANKHSDKKVAVKWPTGELNTVRPQGVMEMDKSQTPPGRDGSTDSDAGKKEYTAKMITPKKAVKDGEKILNKVFNKKKGVAESYHNSKTIITEALIAQKLWENAGRKLMEAQLTADQINQIFQQVEQGATAAGGNRTMLGKGKDAAMAVNQAWEDLKTKVANSGPIKGVDAMYDKAAEQLKQATGGDQGVMKYVQKYRDFAKANPIAQSLIYSALIAAAGISGAGLGGAAALGLFKLVDKLLQGEKFSSAAYAGAKTGALAYGASKVADYFKGPQTPQGGGGLDPNDPDVAGFRQDWQDTVDASNKLPGGSGTLVGGQPVDAATNAAGQIAKGAGSSMYNYDVMPNSMKAMADKLASGIPLSADQMDGLRRTSGQLAQMASGGNFGDITYKVGKEVLTGQDAIDRAQSMFGTVDELMRKSIELGAGAAVKESRSLSESQIYLVIGKIVERQRKIDEGIMDTIKGAAGKAMDWAKTKGANLTTKITADKLLQAWKKAGSPTDSDAVAKIIQSAGVPADSVKQVYGTMKIPFVAAPAAATATAAPATVQKPAATPTPTAQKPAATPVPNTPNKGIRPLTPATPAPAAGTVPAQGFNASNVMKMPGMEKYAKPAPAPAAKTPNYGAAPTGYASVNTTFKQPAAKPAKQPAVTAEDASWGMAEGSQRVDSLVTDALKIMQGATMNDAVAALKTVLGNREYNDRRGHYSFYVRQLMDMYGQQGVAESELNEFLDPQAVAQDPGLEREPTADVIFFGQMPRDFTADTVWEALEAVLPQEYPPGRNTQGHPTSNAERVTTEIAKHQGAVVTTKPLSVAQKLAKTFQTYGIKCKVNAKPGMNEAEQLSVQQLATISDAALDKAYHYGRSQPGNSFGWQANLKSAAFAKQMIDKGVTDIEAISDAIHKGWNVTAQAFVQNPEQFDDTAKLKAAGKLEAKLQQRAQLMKQNYGQLPEEEKEKDRVVARALLQALKGEQDVAEADVDSNGHSVDHADSGEYDYEGDQAKDQLNTIVRAARRLDGMLDDNENMPEWVQMKITNAADYIDTAADYIESNQEPELAEGDKIGNMDADKFDAAMARLKQLAGAGPLKTVYDPTKRVYRNVPVAVQPKK